MATVLPDEKLLRDINQFVLRSNMGEVKDDTSDEPATLEESLALYSNFEQAHPDSLQLIQQVMIYGITKAKTDEQVWGTIGLLTLLDVDKKTRFHAVLPFLEQADDVFQHLRMVCDSDGMASEDIALRLPSAIREVVGIMLDIITVDEITSDGRVVTSREKYVRDLHSADLTTVYDFSLIEDYLRTHPDSWPSELVTFMFDRSPSDAVIAMGKAFGRKRDSSEIMAGLTERTGVASLEYFVGRPEWWAHFYVVTQLEKEPALRTPELLEALAKDSNPLVQEKISNMRTKHGWREW